MFGKLSELEGCLIKGILVKDPNIDFQNYINNDNTGLSSIRNIYLKIIDIESINKINNVIKNMLPNKSKVKIPLYKSAEGGLLVKFTTRKMHWAVGNNINNNKKNKQNWFNQTFIIKFTPKKYFFYQEKSIEGLQFIIKYIDLEI